jgi:hypothetical protein
MQTTSPNSEHYYGGWKIKATPLLSKKLNFQVISIQKHFTNIIETPTNQFVNSKYQKKKSKNMKSNRVRYIFLDLDLFFQATLWV